MISGMSTCVMLLLLMLQQTPSPVCCNSFSVRLALISFSLHSKPDSLQCLIPSGLLLVMLQRRLSCAPVLCRQASSQEASTSEPGQAAESGSAALEKTSPAAILEDMKRRMGWTEPAAPQQVSDEQQMVQAAEGSDRVADGSEVRLHLSCIVLAGS